MLFSRRMLRSLLACLASSLYAAGENWTPTFSAAAVSQYMFRGLRLGGAALQPGVEFDSKNMGLGLWGSMPLADKVPGRSDPEIDPYGWYRFPLNDALTLQPGFTLYTYPNADRSRGYHGATFEPSLALNALVHGVMFTPKVYYDVTLRGPTAELGAAYAWPLRAIGSELDLNANVGTYKWDHAFAGAGPRVRNWGDYWQIGATIPYQIFESRVSLGIAYTEGRNNFLKQGSAPKRQNSLAASRLFVTLTYSRSW